MSPRFASSLISSSLYAETLLSKLKKWAWMLFKSLLVRRLEADGSLSWRDIEDLKYVYMNHICQPISQRVQKLTFPFHHCRVHELHNLLHPTSTCPPLLSVLVSHTAAVWGSLTPSLFPLFLLLQPAQRDSRPSAFIISSAKMWPSFCSFWCRDEPWSVRMQWFSWLVSYLKGRSSRHRWGKKKTFLTGEMNVKVSLSKKCIRMKCLDLDIIGVQELSFEFRFNVNIYSQTCLRMSLLLPDKSCQE